MDRIPELPKGHAWPSTRSTASSSTTGGWSEEGSAEPALPSLAELVGMLRRSWWLVALAGGLGLAAALYLTSREPRRYTAAATIRVVDVGAVAGGLLGEEAKRTPRPTGPNAWQREITVLRGLRVAREAVDRDGLRLFDAARRAPADLARDVKVSLPPDSALRLALSFDAGGYTVAAGAERARSPYGQPVQVGGVELRVPARPAVAETSLVVVGRDVASGWIRRGILTSPMEGADLITAVFTSRDSAASPRAVNAVVHAYAAVDGAMARELLTRRRTFLEQQLGESDQALFAAQAGLDRFRSRTQVFRSAERSAAEQTSMMQLETRQEELDAQRQSLRALLAELERPGSEASEVAVRTLAGSPALTESPIVGQLYARLTQHQAVLDSLSFVGRPDTHEEVRQTRRLIESTATQLVGALRSQLTALDARAQSLAGMRQRSASELRRLSPAEGEESRLLQQVEAARSVSDQLRAEYQRTRIAEAVEVGRVEIVDEATSSTPVQTNQQLKLLLGLLAGLMLGTSGALVRERLHKGVRHRDEVEQLLRVPSLATIPQLAPPRGWRSWRTPVLPMTRTGRTVRTPPGRQSAVQAGSVHPTLVAAKADRDVTAEAFRVLATRLAFAGGGHHLPKTLLVTSALAEEGKTTAAANLAVTLARQGQRVLLMDCDLRRPRLHELFGLPGEPGLVDLMAKRRLPAEVIAATSHDGLRVLPAGTVGDRSADLLADGRLGIVMQWAAQYYDIVVMDSAPILLVPDALALAAHADAVLLVLRVGATSRDVATAAVQQIAHVGGRLVGTVLNDPDGKSERKEQYGYGYGYTHAS